VRDAGGVLWLDLSAGVAGDMLLGALLDAGASLDGVRAAVEAVVPGAVRLSTREVRRAGLRATAVTVEGDEAGGPHRRWTDVRTLLRAADLDDAVRTRALAAFAALARAEAHVHGIPPDDVTFHEVGALDAIADVVGVCAALHDLGLLDVGSRIVASPIALGSGTVRTAHGTLPVPVPAVVELCRGWAVTAGGDGELATPTGAALVTTLAGSCGALPPMALTTAGIGAGTRDRPDRANVVRAVLGRPTGDPPALGAGLEPMVLVEATVDDLDPRLWPAVIDDLLAAGAVDAWLAPVLMKKGRPGQVLTALAEPGLAADVRRVILERTSTLGVRQVPVGREALDRTWVTVDVAEGGLRVKVGLREGRVVHATPEYEDVARLAAVSGRPLHAVLSAAVAAAAAAGLTPGTPFPPTAPTPGDPGAIPPGPDDSPVTGRTTDRTTA